MLSPKRVKWRRQHRHGFKGMAKGGSELSLGDFALAAVDAGRVTSRQIEASRIAISRSVKRGGKLWIRIFSDKRIIRRPEETRMGSGKGNPEYWVALVYPGMIIFEIQGVAEGIVRQATRLVRSKLPIKVQFVTK